VVGGLVLTSQPWSTVFLVAVPPMLLLALDPVPATALADAAREAFTHSFAVAEGIGVVLLVVAAWAFTVLLKAGGRHWSRLRASSVNDDAAAAE
jgi:hypothetical protein